MNEAVCNRCSHSGGVKHLSPICEGQVRCDQRRLCLVPCADDLEEEVGALWSEREVTEFVADEDCRGLLIAELFQERVIGLCGDEMIDHVDGSGEEDLDVGVARGVGDTFGQEGFPGAWVSDQYNVSVF